MEIPKPDWFAPAFARLLQGEDLDGPTAAKLFRDLLGGRVDDCLASALLVALRIKGESVSEIAAAASALREPMLRLTPRSGPVVDTCGTGGDDLGTFNISTAASFVVAGAGVPVVKHGNRAVSSLSGSADVFRELGVSIDSGVEWAQQCLDRIGYAFCYAPHFHPGLAHLAGLRKKLGIRTVFNLLGPLANPAGAEFQLVGVGNADLLDTLAGALAELGTRRAILVCGFDGLDEVTLAAPTMVRIVEDHTIFSDEWDASDFGLAPVALADIRAEGPVESARIIRAVLEGTDGPARRIVVANAAAALFTTRTARNLHEGVEIAEESIRSGKALGIMEQLKRAVG